MNPPSKKTSVLVIDDSALVRGLLTAIINNQADMLCIGAAGDPLIAREMIRKLIDLEDTHKPLSDSALMELLKARGVMVARRTVAKYREGLGIASSTDRVRL